VIVWFVVGFGSVLQKDTLFVSALLLKGLLAAGFHLPPCALTKCSANVF